MTKKKIFYLLFFSALIIVFIAALDFAVPGYFKSDSPPIGLVQPFVMTTQDGNKFTDKETIGKVTTVNFFFTTCTSICPRMHRNLEPVYEQFKNEPAFMMLSFTSDPERDIPTQLKNYTDRLKVDTKKWIFLTGRKDSLYALARNSYKIDDPKNYVASIEDDFLHSQFIALVNKKGEVVSIYDGIKPSEVKQMAAKIQKLLKEQL